MFQDFIYYIKTIYRWLMRCKYSRGFGIQSPSAYSFVTHVVNCHQRYPAYAELEAELENDSKLFRKMGRLLFRLAQFWQPSYVVMGDYEYAPYVYAGYPNALVRMIDDYYFDEETGTQVLVVLDIDWLNDSSIQEELLKNASDQMLLVVFGIHANKEKYTAWKKMISDERTGVTYDLYSCGVIFFDKSKYKQDFKINF